MRWEDVYDTAIRGFRKFVDNYQLPNGLIRRPHGRSDETVASLVATAWALKVFQLLHEKDCSAYGGFHGQSILLTEQARTKDGWLPSDYLVTGNEIVPRAIVRPAEHALAVSALFSADLLGPMNAAEADRLVAAYMDPVHDTMDRLGHYPGSENRAALPVHSLTPHGVTEGTILDEVSLIWLLSEACTWRASKHWIPGFYSGVARQCISVWHDGGDHHPYPPLPAHPECYYALATALHQIDERVGYTLHKASVAAYLKHALLLVAENHARLTPTALAWGIVALTTIAPGVASVGGWVEELHGSICPKDGTIGQQFKGGTHSVEITALAYYALFLWCDWQRRIEEQLPI